MLNVEKARIDKVYGNEKLMPVVTALGTSIGEDFDLSKLRYGKVIIILMPMWTVLISERFCSHSSLDLCVLLSRRVISILLSRRFSKSQGASRSDMLSQTQREISIFLSFQVKTI